MTANANMEAARQYLTDRRDRLKVEIVGMEGRITEIDNILRELEAPLPPVSPRTVTQQPSLKAKKEIVLQAVIKAGAAGVTSEEVSDATGILRGTASSNLSYLKASGKIDHIKPRYYMHLNNAAPDNPFEASAA